MCDAPGRMNWSALAEIGAEVQQKMCATELSFHRTRSAAKTFRCDQCHKLAMLIYIQAPENFTTRNLRGNCGVLMSRLNTEAVSSKL